MSYRVNVRYEDHDGETYGPEPYVLDLRVFEGQAAGLKGMPELISAVNNLVKEHRKWSQGGTGLRVDAWDARREQNRQNRPWHLRKTTQAYEKGGIRGAARYWVTVWRKRHGLWSR